MQFCFISYEIFNFQKFLQRIQLFHTNPKPYLSQVPLTRGKRKVKNKAESQMLGKEKNMTLRKLYMDK